MEWGFSYISFLFLLCIFLVYFFVNKKIFFKNYLLTFLNFVTFWLLSLAFVKFIPNNILDKLQYFLFACIVVSGVILCRSFLEGKKFSPLKLFNLYIPTILFGSSLLFTKVVIGNADAIVPIYQMFIFSYVIYFAFLYGRSQSYFKGMYRKQAKYLFSGVFLIYFSELLCFFSMNRFDNEMLGLKFFGAIMFIILNGYSMLHYGFLDLKLLLNRQTVYRIFALIMLSGYFCMTLILEYFKDYLPLINVNFYKILVGLGSGFYYFKYKYKIDNYLDRVFFPSYYRYKKFINVFSERLSTTLDLRDLLDVILESFVYIFKVETAVLFLVDEERKKYHVKAIHGLENPVRGVEFGNKHPLVNWLMQNKDEWVKAMHQYRKRDVDIINDDLLDELHAVVFLPILYDNKLIGFVILGEKQGGIAYSYEELNIMNMMQYEISVSLINAFSYNELKTNYLETVEALAKAIEAKDCMTKGHSERVTELAVAIARRMKCSRDEIETLRYAGLLHDIGKISIDDTVLNKASLLTEEEYSLVKMHPIAGEDILSHIEFFDDVRHIIRQHHERWDGNGYPDKIKGKNILLLSRILQVADSFDAIVSDRSYRDGRGLDDAIRELRRCNGSQFDPAIIECIEKIYRENLLKLDDDKTRFHII